MGPTGLLNTKVLQGIQTFWLCIPTDIELSYRLLLSLHSIIAVSVYPSFINSWFKLVKGSKISEKFFTNLDKRNLIALEFILNSSRIPLPSIFLYDQRHLLFFSEILCILSRVKLRHRIWLNFSKFWFALNGLLGPFLGFSNSMYFLVGNQMVMATEYRHPMKA